MVRNGVKLGVNPIIFFMSESMVHFSIKEIINSNKCLSIQLQPMYLAVKLSLQDA